jgi:dolichyl-phosphate-mannose--protein O-mannosyl transferase
VILDRLGLCVILLATITMAYRLGDPPSSYYRPGTAPTYVHDECYQAFTAERYLRGDRAAWDYRATRYAMASFDTHDVTAYTGYEWTHPPGAKLVMAACMALFGFEPRSARVGSLLFGVLTLVMSWCLARRMRGARFALLVVTLLACDGMVFVMSRVAMNDIYVTGSLITAIYCVFRYWTAEAHPTRWLLAAGAAFGAALSMKWSALPLLFGSAMAVAARLWLQAREGTLRRRALLQSIGAWLAAFVAAPAGFYLASYIPYFLAGYEWTDFVELHGAMWDFHRDLKATSAYASTWWQWPWVTRPVWFFIYQQPDRVRVIYAMGNPLLWWSFLPSLVWVAVRFVRRRELADALISLGFLGVWLPWAFVSRLAFIQYLLPAVPFGALAVATTLDDLADLVRKNGRFVPILYAAACLAVFVNFYPFWSAAAVTRDELQSRRWFWFDAWRKGLHLLAVGEPPPSARHALRHAFRFGVRGRLEALEPVGGAALRGVGAILLAEHRGGVQGVRHAGGASRADQTHGGVALDRAVAVI